MTDELWDRPVEVTTDCGDHFKNVRNAREALECLMTCWPRKGGKAFARAKRACMDAMQGRATAASAVEAFTAAASAADILKK